MHAVEYSRQSAWWPSGTRGLRVCEAEYEYGAPDWQRADRELRRIARGQAGLDYDAAVWILRAVQAGTARMLGMSSDIEYVSRVLHYGRREAYERVRVAKALAELPRLAEALRSGELGWCAVRELSRILVAETEEVWLDAVMGMTVRDIEVMVAGRREGDLPTDPKSSEARELVLSFRVSVATAALFRDALQALRREAGSHLSDDDALAQLARTVLQGPRDQGRASYQIAVDVCPSCKKATRTSDGESVPIDESVVAMAACDAEVVDLRPTERVRVGTPPGDAGSARGPEDAAVTDEGAVAEDAGADDAAVTEHRVVAEDAGSPRAATTSLAPQVGRGPQGGRATQTVRGTQTTLGPQTVRATQTIPPATQTGRGPQTARATQSIPPATRRLVLRRDHGRCVIPGCSHATFVDLHHVTPRSEGGTHDPDGLATVCGAHHAALHEGRLSIEGRASTGFVVRHADGTAYGDEVTGAQGVMADVFLALRALGFKETESRRALAAAHTHVGKNACFDSLLRRALAVLRATS